MDALIEKRLHRELAACQQAQADNMDMFVKMKAEAASLRAERDRYRAWLEEAACSIEEIGDGLAVLASATKEPVGDFEVFMELARNIRAALATDEESGEVGA